MWEQFGDFSTFFCLLEICCTLFATSIEKLGSMDGSKADEV